MTTHQPAPQRDSLDQPQRQSPIAIVAGIFSVQALQGLIPIIIVAFGNRRSIGLVAVPLGLIALVAISAINWSRTTFWVENGEMVLEKGLLNKSRTQIPLDRIQQIGTEQGIIQQIFNVRQVNVDSAGTGVSEFQLAAVTDEVVAELRGRVVGADKAGTAAPPSPAAPFAGPPLGPPGMGAPTPGTGTFGPPAPGPAGPLGPPQGAIPVPAEDRRTIVLRHEFADLVQLAISRPSPQVIIGLLALGGFGLGGVVERFLTENITGVVGAVILVIVIIILAIAVLIIGTMIREFQLTVWRSQEGLRLTAGLLNKRERLARTERVQVVRQQSNFVERRFGRTSMFLPQASSVQAGAATSATQFSIPGAPTAKADDIANLFLAADRPEPQHPIDRRIVWRKTLLEGILPAVFLLICAASVYAVEEASNWIVLPLVIGAVFLVAQARVAAVLFHKRWSWNLAEGHVVIQRGFLTIDRTEAALRKVQSVRIRQGFWQRRKQLASVHLGLSLIHI